MSSRCIAQQAFTMTASLCAKVERAQPTRCRGCVLAFCVGKMTDTNTCLCSWQLARLGCDTLGDKLSYGVGLCRANVFGDRRRLWKMLAR